MTKEGSTFMVKSKGIWKLVGQAKGSIDAV